MMIIFLKKIQEQKYLSILTSIVMIANNFLKNSGEKIINIYVIKL